MLNIYEAASSLSKNQNIQLLDKGFVRADFKYGIMRYFSKAYDKKQIQKVADYIRTHLQRSNGEEKAQYLVLADAFVKRYNKDFNGKKIAKIFDRVIVPYRKDTVFFHKDNCASYVKWLKYGMPSKIYHHYPEFCTFMEKTGLLSQMKVTKDCPQLIAAESHLPPQPHLIVNGELTPWSKIKDQFIYVNSGRYNEKFIIHKTTRDVYTYLDNGKGLQPHHPYLSSGISTKLLTEDELKAVTEKARDFVRPSEKDLTEEERSIRNDERIFIIQLVTSYTNGPNTNLHELLTRRKHPYLRLIAGEDVPEKGIRKGDMYDVGYGWVNKVPIPFVTTQGRFRSPDMWEYVPAEERIVTNIPVTRLEARAFADYTLQYHKDEVNLGNSTGFHILRQNCSCYVRASLAVAGIEVPTEISFTDCIKRIAPDWFKDIAKGYKYFKAMSIKLTKRAISALPKNVQNKLTKAAVAIEDLFAKIVGAMAALSLAPANMALGGSFGVGGAAFVLPNDEPAEIKPHLSDWKNWFKLSSYNVNLPGILQEWQREQASTVIYKRPIKLTVVP